MRIAKRVQRWTGGATPFWAFMARHGLYGFLAVLFAFAGPISFLSLREVVGELFAPVVVALGIASLLQYVIKRPRPTVTKTDFHQWMLHYSFPSAHASLAFAMAVATSAVALRAVPQVAAIFVPAACILALGIAFSRVVVGVHHPSDVVAGAVLGSTIGLLFVTL